MNKVIGKIIVEAVITNTGNLLVGSGDPELYDFEVFRDDQGNIGIPASGFTGMLSKNFFNRVNFEIDDIELKESLERNAGYFWGTDKSVLKNTSQSHLLLDELKCVSANPVITVRDGVGIDPETNQAIKGHKYDYELLEPGAEFKFRMEVTLREEFDVELIRQFVMFIVEEGHQDNRYRQGAFVSHDFGKVKWKGTPAVQVFLFYTKGSNDSKRWWKYLENNEVLDPEFNEKYPYDFAYSFLLKKANTLYIGANFNIKHALMIGGSGKSLLTDNLDKTHIKNSKGDALIPSKSIRGAIRKRAFRILNTLGVENPKALIDGLFGYADEKSLRRKRGRIIPTEVSIGKGRVRSEQIQNRVKIDRFTGGTVRNALFSTQPVWHCAESFNIGFELIDAKPEEVALILLVMKDLMHEDLAIGGEKNIGRGVMQGSGCYILHNGEEAESEFLQEITNEWGSYISKKQHHE